MSTQTGIQLNDEALEFFASCREGDSRKRFRMAKVSIVNEALVLDGTYEACGDWRSDWDRTVLKAVDDSEPCFIFYRLDEKDGETFRWLLISWSPDSSSVRNKMLYASTKASLRKEFGSGQIKDDLYGNVKQDVSLAGYLRHCESSSAPGPLSPEEIEREEAKLHHSSSDIAIDSKHQTMTGIGFPLSNDAEEALFRYGQGSCDYVQFHIDVDEEVIKLDRADESCAVNDLPERVPDNAPRYHMFRFKHTHEGDYLESTVFVYTMPGYGCSIKERMLYSSGRNAMVQTIEGSGVEIQKKIEVESGKELTEKMLQEELHPKKNLLSATKFRRPAPPNRGNRRMVKSPGSGTVGGDTS